MFFPYYTSSEGNAYIFSALNCPCSLMDINNAYDSKLINQTYSELLIANLWEGDEGPKPAYFAPV